MVAVRAPKPKMCMLSIMLSPREDRWWRSPGPTGQKIRAEVAFRAEGKAEFLEIPVQVVDRCGEVVLTAEEAPMDGDDTAVDVDPLPPLNDGKGWRELYRHFQSP